MGLIYNLASYHSPRTDLLISHSGRSRGYAQANRRRLGKESRSAALGVTAIRLKERILSAHRRCNLKMKRLSALWLSRVFESERSRRITYALASMPGGQIADAAPIRI
jgi:hypothetical protein